MEGEEKEERREEGLEQCNAYCAVNTVKIDKYFIYKMTMVMSDEKHIDILINRRAAVSPCRGAEEPEKGRKAIFTSGEVSALLW